VALGLVDMGFDVIQTPIGPSSSRLDHRLAAISFDDEPEHTWSSSRASPARACSALRGDRRARRELDEYFEGRRRAFDLALDLRALPDFTVTVLRELARVPYGETTTTESSRRGWAPRAARRSARS